MRDKVFGGDLTDGQKYAMSRFSKDENGKIKNIDFYNLYDEVFPSDIEYELISLGSNNYLFSLAILEWLE